MSCPDITPQSAWTCDGSPGPGEVCSGSQCKSGTPTLSTGGGGSQPTPPPTRTNQVIHPNGNAAKCLAAASNANNAAVEIEDCVPSSAAQLWTVKGFNLQIFGNKCLDDTSGNTANGAKMQIYTCNTGNTNQQWDTSSGSTIQLQNTGKCLDNTDGSTANGNVVSLHLHFIEYTLTAHRLKSGIVLVGRIRNGTLSMVVQEGPPLHPRPRPLHLVVAKSSILERALRSALLLPAMQIMQLSSLNLAINQLVSLLSSPFPTLISSSTILDNQWGHNRSIR